MAAMSFDHLQALIKAKKCPLALTLEPRSEYIPPFLLKGSFEQYGQTREGAADAALRYSLGLIEGLTDTIPALRIQSAYFERLGWQGMRALEQVIAAAHEKGLFVIADSKQGQSGSAARALGESWLGRTRVGEAQCEVYGADCLTVNAYLGSDTIAPLLELCRELDKCLLVLVKTANPSGGELQDMVAGDRVVHQVMGDLAQRLGGQPGKFGYSRAGAVVETTYPSDLRALRRRLEQTFFLLSDALPPQEARFAFDKYGRGALVSVARPLLSAWQRSGRDGRDYPEAAREAARELREAYKQYVTVL